MNAIEGAIERIDLAVGEGDAARRIAVEHRPGRAPGLFWLAGYRSDMAGSKAMTLDRYGAENGRAVTRFDYSGHGVSGGDFDKGTITRWLEEARAVFELTAGEQILVGSSMGGWIALLLARALLKDGQRRLKGIVLIAPAADMTEELMKKEFSPRQMEDLVNNGYVDRPSQYSDEPYRITRALIEDGRHHLMLGGVIETGCPVTILQGGQDPDVPQEHAIRLTTHLLHDPVTLTLIPDGDHRLSREEDLKRLTDAIAHLIEG
ncbi:alpha/beta hydrolase [Devosia nitrariae]|uniref:Palmitoyl-protein thioesterase ABHD10, mitochondrial n=1 Tax=Devosia nitrariae TaxID=2071872 RepID=A0ABQ5W123_9HYPH|nr:alpha/beta hydrolase [Devosia nitrariae]GLQ53431.1 alpha/beta hydrolase [Devosia nitrariae]